MAATDEDERRGERDLDLARALEEAGAVEDEEAGAVEADWKFAAMVLDRMCLFFFTTFTIVATCAVLAVAPHIVVK